MTRNTARLLTLALSAGCALPAFADAIPYTNVGHVATQMITTATTNGINVFYAGSTAGFDNQIDVYDVATGYDSGKILDNKSTAVGTEISVGTGAGQINAGDQLVFYIDSPDGHFASLGNYSADGENHAYITAFTPGKIGDTLVPEGLYVGMEDLAAYHTDFNYNDDDFVFTGVQASSVTPEPASLLLLGSGLLGTFAIWRRERPAAEESV